MFGTAKTSSGISQITTLQQRLMVHSTMLLHGEYVTDWNIGCYHSGSLFIRVCHWPEPTRKNCSESSSKFMDLNEFVPICHVGNFHRSLSGMNQLMDLHLIRSWSWAPNLINETVDSKKFFGFSKCTHLPEIFCTHVLMQENLKDFQWLLTSLLLCMSGVMTIFVYSCRYIDFPQFFT